MNIHQLLSGFTDGDAVSRQAFLMRDVFRGWGAASDIFAEPETVFPALRPDTRSLSEYAPGPGDICVHHYGIASPACDVFVASRAKKILVYHNITPAEFFAGFDDDLAARLRGARASLRDVAAKSSAVWADSKYNAGELERLGIAGVEVFPLMFSPRFLECPPDPSAAERIAKNLKNILFVGRIAPNKRIEDLVRAFVWFNKAVNPYSRLVIVGSDRSAPRYHTMLRMLANELDLPNACFEGFVSDAELVAYYRAADVYVCASAHEGYCLPLVEAMHMGVPVIARNVGGVPEAMGRAGVLYEELDAVELAELIHRVLTDSALREEVLLSQKKRMEELRARNFGAELKALMSDLL